MLEEMFQHSFDASGVNDDVFVDGNIGANGGSALDCNVNFHPFELFQIVFNVFLTTTFVYKMHQKTIFIVV